MITLGYKTYRQRENSKSLTNKREATPRRMKLLYMLSAAVLAFLPLVSLLTSEPAAADTATRVCENVPGSDCSDAADEGTGGVQRLAEVAMDVIWALVSAISVLVIIIAGFMYVVSAGNPDKTKRAKNAIMYAVIGLVVAFFARTIVQFVLNSV